MTPIARFSPPKLILFGSLAVLACVVCVTISVLGYPGDSHRGWIALGGSILGLLLAVRTGWTIWRWQGPAICVAQGELRAHGLCGPVPVGEIEDIQLSVTETSAENWSGVLIYRPGRPTLRVNTWLLAEDRKVIAQALRRALGLSDAGLRR